MDDIQRKMKEKGLPINKCYIRKIIRNEGYQFRKAKKVLTSNDPNYLEKLKKITEILNNLSANESFFSIDEFGPFAVKKQGGKSLVKRGYVEVIPQYQKSKGSLIITGALELSTNQITHFSSNKKNTNEMIKLLDILIVKYSDKKCIYLSWDTASWHKSKKLLEKIKEINSTEFRLKNKVPFIEIAPLPSGAQFLNVIESIYSGMAKAIIHNSDYESVEECKEAIDLYFKERNEHFKINPKKAGNKIWGKERTNPKFRESNNCKDPIWSYC